MADKIQHTHDNDLTHSMVHYLLAIHKLKEAKGYARVTDIAHEMGLTKGSVSTALTNLKKINWARSNGRDWEGRVMMAGRLTKASNSVVLATAFIKKIIGIELSPEEIKAEAVINKSRERK
jgi:Mn-dependent DtxR family transcriptional regulator